ncbi:hypothetical protein [Nonomuraea sp. bgisy101]|uniref:hypothetical protein n=1 Tax=Nonomuraea sp. bgisy101 TaxID=3413784 RepID=UPI003D731E99
MSLSNFTPFLMRWWAFRPTWIGVLALFAGILFLGIFTDMPAPACCAIICGAYLLGSALLAAVEAYADACGIPDDQAPDDEPQLSDEPEAAATPAIHVDDSEPPTRAPAYALDDELEPGRYVRLTPRDDGEVET